MTDLNINLNQIAKVKLTTFGEEILKDKHYEFQEMMKKHSQKHETKPFKLQLDEEGYYRSQLWSLMRDFGQYTNIGMVQPFLATIIIEP